MFRITNQPINALALRNDLNHPKAGAVCVFEGMIRNHNDGKAVSGLFYEAYAEMGEREGNAILHEALERFAILSVQAEHRVGDLQIGDLAVWVGVAAAHRDSAFAACRYVIDEIKSRVPIWKRERYVEGDASWLHPNT